MSLHQPRDKDEAKLASGITVWVPDRILLVTRPGDVLHPAHGHTSFAVEDIDGDFIGWLSPERAGFPSVLEWMKQNKYIILCRCQVCIDYRRTEGLP